jgi:hypothetical protein
MKTFYNEAAVLWHQQILDINQQADPIAYRPKPKNLSKAWRSKAASISDRKHARDVPRIVPSYNATSHHSATYGRTQRAWYVPGVPVCLLVAHILSKRTDITVQLLSRNLRNGAGRYLCTYVRMSP